MASLTDSEEIKGKGKGQGFCGGKEKKKRKEEASGIIPFIHRRVGILMKFPKYPQSKLQDITLLVCIFLCECIYIIITHKNHCAPLFWFGWPGPVGLARGATKKNNNDSSV